MLVWPWKWNGCSLHHSCSTQLVWPMGQIDPWQWPALFLWTKQFCFDHRNSDVLLMNISPSKSVLSAEYLTVFVFRRLEFAFGLLDLDLSPYLLFEKWFFFLVVFKIHTCIQICLTMFPNNITHHSNLNAGITLSFTCTDSMS